MQKWNAWNRECEGGVMTHHNRQRKNRNETTQFLQQSWGTTASSGDINRTSLSRVFLLCNCTPAGLWGQHLNVYARLNRIISNLKKSCLCGLQWAAGTARAGLLLPRGHSWHSHTLPSKQIGSSHTCLSELVFCDSKIQEAQWGSSSYIRTSRDFALSLLILRLFSARLLLGLFCFGEWVIRKYHDTFDHCIVYWTSI